VSLVSDALRKARQEAAARGEKRRGVYAVTLHTPSTGGRLGLGLVLGAVLSFVAAVAGGGVAWWLLRDAPDTQSSTRVAPAIESSASVQPTATILGAAPQTTSASEPEESGLVASEPTQASQPTPESKTPAARRQLESATTVEKEAVEETPRDERPVKETPSAVAQENRTFSIEANLGGTILTLDYIVFRNNDPFAQINGQVVHIGFRIEGMKVAGIESDRVILEDADGEVVLLAK